MAEKYEKFVCKSLLLVDKDCQIIADIGAGTGKYHHFLMKKFGNPKIYAVEPNEEKRNEIKLAIPIDGEFRDFKVPEKVDLIFFSAAWHHCSDEDMPYLFENIKKISKPTTKILFVNEFYVNWYWIVKRIIACLRAGHLDIFTPLGGNHFRTKLQIKRIFKKYGYNIKFHSEIPNPFFSFPYPRKNKLSEKIIELLLDIDRFLGWRYYYFCIQ